MSHESIHEMKPQILDALRRDDRTALIEAYYVAAARYHTLGHFVEADATDWSEVNSAIESRWGADGLHDVKRRVGARLRGPTQTKIVEDAVARAMRDGRLPK